MAIVTELITGNCDKERTVIFTQVPLNLKISNLGLLVINLNL